jgi:hypothetical protein
VNVTDSTNRTFMHCLMDHSSIDLVEHIGMKYGWSIDFDIQDREGVSPKVSNYF